MDDPCNTLQHVAAECCNMLCEKNGGIMWKDVEKSIDGELLTIDSASSA